MKKITLFTIAMTVISLQAQAQVGTKSAVKDKAQASASKPAVSPVEQPQQPVVPPPQILKMNRLKSDQVSQTQADLLLFRSESRLNLYNVLPFVDRKTGYLSILFSGFSSMGLGAFMTVKIEADEPLTSPKYLGQLMIQSCQASGKPILKSYTSLTELFNDENNISEDLIESCQFRGSKMVSNIQTQTSSVPYATWKDIELNVNGDSASLQMSKPQAERTGNERHGYSPVENGDITQKTPWLFLSRKNNDSMSAQAVDEVNRVLVIYEKALALIRSEQANRELPETVMYLNSQRGQITASLGRITSAINKSEVSPRQVLNIMISFRMAVHKLDQALGLASQNQLSIGKFIQR